MHLCKMQQISGNRLMMESALLHHEALQSDLWMSKTWRWFLIHKKLCRVYSSSCISSSLCSDGGAHQPGAQHHLRGPGGSCEREGSGRVQPHGDLPDSSHPWVHPDSSTFPAFNDTSFKIKAPQLIKIQPNGDFWTQLTATYAPFLS